MRFSFNIIMEYFPLQKSGSVYDLWSCMWNMVKKIGVEIFLGTEMTFVVVINVNLHFDRLSFTW